MPMFKKVAISSLLSLAILSGTAQAHGWEEEFSSETGKVIGVSKEDSFLSCHCFVAELDNGRSVDLEDRDVKGIIGKEIEVTFISHDPYDEEEFVEYRVLE